MKFKDYYETLGVERAASEDEIKRTYRKLARKYHPDVSKEANAEARFKDLGEAYAVLKDPEKRAAYDRMGRQWKTGQDFDPPPDWGGGFDYRGGEAGSSDGTEFSEFFEALFGRHGGRGTTQQGARPRARHARGQDHHAKVLVDLIDAYRGAQRSISLRMPVVDDEGQIGARERTLEVNIPKGIREGQHLRLSGQGGPGLGDGPPGDLYLEIGFNPEARFRVDGRDVYLDLPLSPWEAALGAAVSVPTPDGTVQLTIPPESKGGRQLRLKGKGIPGDPPGDMYAVLTLALPTADTESARDAYRAMAKAFAFNPRAHF